MSYVVLARKYRPQTFDDVVGQQHVTRTLTNAISSNRIAHAYLFTGTRGVGKTTAARILAKALNCTEQKGPNPTPCNKCINCLQITDGKSVDVFEIDGASNTGVDDIRELRENVRFMPQSSRYKIYIVDEVHMLSNNAFNALLKTLEEPPPHVIFVFATTEVHKIPDTVLSRCQQYDFKMIPQRMIYEHLTQIISKEGVGMDDESLRLVARKADGSMRDAMSYLDQALSYGGDKITAKDLLDILGIVDRQILIDLSKSILSLGPDQTLSVLERLQSTTWDVKQFYGDLLEHFRNLMVAKVSKKPEAMIDTTKEELDDLVEQVSQVSLETLQRLFNILVENEDLVIRSQNPRLVLEMTLLRMACATPVQSLDQLVNELAKIKDSIAKGGADTGTPFQVAKKEEAKAKAINQKPSTPAVNKSKIEEKPETPPAEEVQEKSSSLDEPPLESSPRDIGKEFIVELAKKNELLASYFDKATLLSQKDQNLVYGFDTKFIYTRVCSMESECLDALRKVGGAKAVIKFEKIKGVKKENEVAKKQRLKAEAGAKVAKQRQEGIKNETVRLVLDTFEDTQTTVTPINNKNN